MRLLTKQEISTLKSSERKREIDEGTKLAKKIDTLREVSANEESKLATFRQASLLSLRNDVTELSKVRDDIVREIDDKRRILNSLIERIDTADKIITELLN